MATKILTKEVDTLTHIDSVDANTTYIGEAKLGASTSDAVWQILKIVKVGTVTSILSADSDLRFNNVFDDRTSLTYG
jgi:hypothetical protein